MIPLLLLLTHAFCIWATGLLVWHVRYNKGHKDGQDELEHELFEKFADPKQRPTIELWLSLGASDVIEKEILEKQNI